MSHILDTRTIADPAVPGLSYRVDIVPDPDETPYSTNVYTEADTDPEMLAAWNNDEWQFVGVIVTPIIDTVIELDNLDASLWGVAFGDLPGSTIDAERLVNHYPGPDLIKEARTRVAEHITEISTVFATVALQLAEQKTEI